MKRLFYSFVGLFLVVGTAITISYAWFLANGFEAPEISGYSSAAYFASGDGSEENPFEITNKRHLYNLAWLQYLGNFNQTDESGALLKQYYFKISASEIDMEGYALPPIGTEKNPFVGVFDGGGCIIKNLTSSNSIADLKNHPSTVSAVEDSSIIGMFGIIGNYDNGNKFASFDSIIPSVTNLYLDDIAVSSVTSTSLVGLLAGYVGENGKISNVGIHYSKLNLASGVSMIEAYSAISKYALIGDYDGETVEWVDKPSSGGPGYGASTDLGYLESQYGSTGITKGMAYPFQAKSNDLIEPTATTKNMQLSAGQKSVTIATTQEATSSNIGYYVGSDVKFYSKKVTYENFYYPNNSSQSTLLPYTDGTTTYNAPSQDIIDYLNSEKGQYQMRLTGSEIDIMNEGGLVVVENGKVGDYEGDVLLPQRCVWVAPRQAGTLKFVFPNVENGVMGLRINRLIRSEPKNYASYISSSTQLLEFNAVLLGNTVYYFEIEVTQSDVDNGYEYAITGGNSYKTYASYVDIGAAGGGTTPTYTGEISGVDFVYYNDSLGYSKVDGTDKSEVVFEITGTSTGVVLYFKRKETLGVLYYVSGSGVTVTPSGAGTNSAAKDENCDEA